MKSLCLLQRRT